MTYSTPERQKMLDDIFAKLDAMPDSKKSRDARLNRICDKIIASGRLVLIEENIVRKVVA